MSVEIASAYVSLTPKFEGVQAEIKKALDGGASATAGATAGKTVGTAVGGGILSRLKTYAAPIAAVVASVAGVAAIKKTAETFEQTASATRLLQRQIGGTSTQVSTFIGAMQLSGVTVQQSQVALRMFSKNVGLAGQNSNTAAKYQKLLGFSFLDAAGNAKPMSDLLPQLADKFQKLPDGPAKTAIAMQLFGRSGTAVIPFLNKGSAGLAELAGQAKNAGLVIDDVAIKTFVNARTSARDFGIAMQGAGTAVGGDVLPVLDAFASVGRAALIPVLNEVAKAALVFRPIFVAIGDAGEQVATALGAALPKALDSLLGKFLQNEAGINHVADTISAAGTKIADLITSISSSIGSGAGFGSFIAQFASLATAISPLNVVLQALAPILPQVSAAAAQVGTALGAALKLALPSLSQLIVQLLPSLVQIITALAPLLPPIVQILVVLAPLIAALASVLSFLVTNGLVPLVQLQSFVLTFFSAFVTGANATQVATKALAGGFGPLVQAIGQVGERFGSGVLAIRTALTSAGIGIGTFVRSSAAFFASLVAVVTSAIGAVITRVTTLIAPAQATFSRIVSIVTAALGQARAVVTGALAVVAAVFASAWSRVTSTVVSAVARIVTAVSSGVSRVLGFVREIGPRVVAAVGNFGSLLYNAGRSIVQGLINGIRSMVGAAAGAMSGVMNTVKSFLPHSPAKQGPFSGSGWTAVAKAGEAITNQFASRIRLDAVGASGIGKLTAPLNSSLRVAGGFDHDLAQVHAASNSTLNYYAAPGQSYDEEAALRAAMRRKTALQI